MQFMKTPRHLLATSLLLLLLGASSPLLRAAETPTPSKPNILFILSDDHALRTISAYDGAINKTPNIDRLAHEGAVFDNWFVGNSICCPCRASLMTGKHSTANGVTGNSSAWNGNQWVYSREIGKAGYQTALIGKWHLKGNPTDEFQHWEILTGDGGQGSYYNTEFLSQAGSSKPDGYSTDIITDKSIDWLKNRDKSKPFLLEVHFKAPHTPRTPNLPDMGSYDGMNFPEPSTLFDDYATRQPCVSKTFMGIKGMHGEGIGVMPTKEELAAQPGKMPKMLQQMTPEQREVWHKFYDPRNREYEALKASGKLDGQEGTRYIYQRFVKDYVRCIDGMDRDIGRILSYLDESGLAKNTIVIYSADQGFFTGEHGWAEKRWMYEESFRAPFLMRWPGTIQPETHVKALTQNIDLAPTLLTAAGLSVPTEVQGRPLQPLLGGTIPPDWRKDLLYTYYDGGTPQFPAEYNMPRHMGVRDDRYKLISFYDYNTWEFYDLQKDPHELNNVYDKPEYAKDIARLKERLTALKAEYKIPEPPALTEKKHKAPAKNPKNKKKKNAQEPEDAAPSQAPTSEKSPAETGGSD